MAYGYVRRKQPAYLYCEESQTYVSTHDEKSLQFNNDFPLSGSFKGNKKCDVEGKLNKLQLKASLSDGSPNTEEVNLQTYAMYIQLAPSAKGIINEVMKTAMNCWLCLTLSIFMA
jgi:hypothetical protein